MRMVFLPVNQAWVFKFGEQLISLDGPAGGQRLFNTKAEAIDAAKAVGLKIDKHGNVTVR
jgi:hypothetical protein